MNELLSIIEWNGMQGPVGNYAIMIAEEDGDIDTDLPGKVL